MSRGLDYSRASTARVYNYYLGGKSWSRVDKEAAEKVIRSAPDAPEVARENLRFAGRAASWAVSAYGIRQVIDIGVGIVDDVPIPAVEECVLEAAPDAVVVAFDHDEVVLAHGRALRPGYGGVLRGDVTDLDSIFDHPAAVDLFDANRPMVVVLAAVLHFIGQASEVMAGLRVRLAPGSVVVLSHATSTDTSGDRVGGITQAYEGASSSIIFRSEEEIKALAHGWDILTPPGLVDVQRWAPNQSCSLPSQGTVRVVGMAAVLPASQLEQPQGGAR